MIITRTAETIDFQLSESQRITVNVGRVASASMSVERNSNGTLVHALVLLIGTTLMPRRIEAGFEQVAAMHSRIVEVMRELDGPTMQRPGAQADRTDGLIY